jgi:HupE/UreJ protein
MPVITVVTAFTIAHSITLSLAALQIVVIPSAIVKPACCRCQWRRPGRRVAGGQSDARGMSAAGMRVHIGGDRTCGCCDLRTAPDGGPWLAHPKFRGGHRHLRALLELYPAVAWRVSANPSCMKWQNAWVGDRTLCYLASGRPLVVQDTGPSAILPKGLGMFASRRSKRLSRRSRELWLKLGDDQAAWFAGTWMTSMPSVNLTPAMTFGN